MMIIPRRPAGRPRLAACHVPLLLWLLHIIFTDAMQAWYCGGQGEREAGVRGGGASCINYPNEDWAQPT